VRGSGSNGACVVGGSFGRSLRPVNSMSALEMQQGSALSMGNRLVCDLYDSACEVFCAAAPLSWMPFSLGTLHRQALARNLPSG
jgi:hypothetical protein